MGIFKIKYTNILIIPFLLPFLYYNSVGLYDLNEVSMLQNVIWYSGVTLTVLSFWGVNQRITRSYSQLCAYLLFLPLVWLFISTNNYLIFFMCYEFFLLPSFFIVFLGSPNRRGVLASIYFLMWTQIGSFLVFLSVVLLFLLNNSFLFTSCTHIDWYISLLALVGFGIKVPMWPAHYWLTKTHVEAPTYFSIYLSGFLVKTALYGIWLFIYSNNFTYTAILLVLAVIGVLDSSFKMWSQVDLKKLVAYGTVQEMNLILIGFSLATSTAIKASSLFILAHTILSTIFFLMSDSLYRRFSSRSTSSIRGLTQSTPVLGYALFICCLFFAGLPFTLKFIVEVYIFINLFNLNAFLFTLTIIVCNWFGLVSFMKHWFGLLFGNPVQENINDLSYREFIIYFSLCSLLIIISYLSFYLI